MKPPTSSKKFQPDHLDIETLDYLVPELEEIPEDIEKESLYLNKYTDTEELRLKTASRNKRAIIERIIALWELERKLDSYPGQSELECA